MDDPPRLEVRVEPSNDAALPTGCKEVVALPETQKHTLAFTLPVLVTLCYFRKPSKQVELDSTKSEKNKLGEKLNYMAG